MELARALEIAAGQGFGAVVTLKRDGRPQLSNVGFVVGDDGVIRVSITATRAKTKNLRRDGRVSLYVGQPDFGAYLVLEGDAELGDVAMAPGDAAADELVALYRSMAGEHPNWDEYRQAMVDDRRLVLRIRPERAYGMWS